jgi:hypothetical protein
MVSFERNWCWIVQSWTNISGNETAFMVYELIEQA